MFHPQIHLWFTLSKHIPPSSYPKYLFHSEAIDLVSRVSPQLGFNDSNRQTISFLCSLLGFRRKPLIVQIGVRPTNTVVMYVPFDRIVISE